MQLDGARQDALLDGQAPPSRSPGSSPLLSRKALICSSVLPETATLIDLVPGRHDDQDVHVAGFCGDKLSQSWRQRACADCYSAASARRLLQDADRLESCASAGQREG